MQGACVLLDSLTMAGTLLLPMEAFCKGDRSNVLFHLYCTLCPAPSPGTLPPHSQQVRRLTQALQHRGLGAALSSLPNIWDSVMDTLVRAEVRPVSLGFAGQPQPGGLQDLRLGAARLPLSGWFMSQILQRGVTGLLLAVGMVGQGLSFMFRVCTFSQTIKIPLSVIHLRACYCHCHHLQ